MPEFREITIEGLEEGEFLTDANDAVSSAARTLLKHIRVHDDDAAAEVTMKVRIRRMKGNGDGFTIRTAIATKLPGRPDHLTQAIQEGDRLWVAASGSREDSPRQGVLATRDGRAVVDGVPVNTTTGEVLADKNDNDADGGRRTSHRQKENLGR